MEIEQLIEKCQQHDVKAQEALYRRLAPLLLGVCMKYCKNKANAEDLFQESFIIIFNKIHQFKYKGSFEGWAKRITINTILSHFRKTQHTESINEEKTALIEDHTEFEHANFSLDTLLTLIHKLPSQYKLVFNMYVLDDFSHQEIAMALDISVGTSKSNLSRARAILKKELLVLEQQKNMING